MTRKKLIKLLMGKNLGCSRNLAEVLAWFIHDTTRWVSYDDYWQWYNDTKAADLERARRTEAEPLSESEAT